MATFDLDAYRAARADELQPKTLALAGEEIAFPASLPAAVVEDIANGRLGAAMVRLAGEDGARKLLDAGLSIEEINALLSELYGISAGN